VELKSISKQEKRVFKLPTGPHKGNAHLLKLRAEPPERSASGMIEAPAWEGRKNSTGMWKAHE